MKCNFSKPELALIADAVLKRAIRQESEARVVDNPIRAKDHRDKAEALRAILGRLDHEYGVRP